LIPAIKLEGDDCNLWQGRTAVRPHLDARVSDVHGNSAFDVGAQPWSLRRLLSDRRVLTTTRWLTCWLTLADIASPWRWSAGRQ
jgi:hypothetical protein